MRYSLVNASALGFDLVRLPGGIRTAEVLLAACEASPAELSHLAGVHPGLGREPRWDSVRERTQVRRPVLSASDLAEPALRSAALDATDGGSELLTRIAEAPLGDLDSLSSFVRHEALEATWTRVGGMALQDFRAQLASDVLVDAATSAYCSDLLEADERRRLASPYLQVRRSGTLHPVEPTTGTVGAVLATVSAWCRAEREALATAVDANRSQTSRWAGAMHEAGWAAHLSGRTRRAAVAQLQAVLAFRSAGFSTTEAASGAWNAVSGVVQALVVEDLLAADDLDELLQPWLLAQGSDPRAGRTTPD
ncbi:hypothetical protein V3N99_10985 [Dermatophilaceae bacterium Soc4.6]